MTQSEVRTNPLDLFEANPRLPSSGVVGLTGGCGVTTAALLAEALFRSSGATTFLLTAHHDEAEEAFAIWRSLGTQGFHFSPLDPIASDVLPNAPSLTRRLEVMQRAAEGRGMLVAASMSAVMQGAPNFDEAHQWLVPLQEGQRRDPSELVKRLAEAGYHRTAIVSEPGDFALRGDVLDVFPASGELPFRLDFFGDELESIRGIDLDSMASAERRGTTPLLLTPPEVLSQDAQGHLVDYLPGAITSLLLEPLDLVERGRSAFDRSAIRSIHGPPRVLEAILKRSTLQLEISRSAGTADQQIEWPLAGLPELPPEPADALLFLHAQFPTARFTVYVEDSGEIPRAQRMIDGVVASASDLNIKVDALRLERGFASTLGEGHIHVPWHELLGRWQRPARQVGLGSTRSLDAFVEMEPGDYVVHREHGIAQYLGLELRREGDDEEEFLILLFSGGTRLAVPAVKAELIQKYIGGRVAPELSSYGGGRWKKKKGKVKDAVRDLAAELIRVQAVRESTPGISYPSDTEWQYEFEAGFPFSETEDQLSAIEAVKRDMAKPRPMDRLVCGDVGFGKTEVALRAAFKAVESGRQVAVLVPTTVLAEQHLRSFRERFAGFPFRVEGLSRLRTREEALAVLKATTNGEVDVLVGTHRLLSKDVAFSDLGLVVIDEEQRFGVEHKQRLLELRALADVLVLTATPIPRTLHMSMMELRDISTLTTPPVERRPVVTEVIPYQARRVQRAIQREIDRGGQVYVLHNRVQDIEEVANEISSLVPQASVAVGHGQMPSSALDSVMRSFVQGKSDVLVSTTIIENGLDVPRANTMIIRNANRFGLAQLHQLRGRVGRSRERAFCYLMLPENGIEDPAALERLRTLERYSMLGAGFRIAMRDLEIRGAGNLLGPEQSGHILTVGYEMYCQLLEQAVSELRQEVNVDHLSTSVDLGIRGGIPVAWIPVDSRRLDVYRRIARADSPDALRRLSDDLSSAYGKLPRRTKLLFDLALIRVAAAQSNVAVIARDGQDVVFTSTRPEALRDKLLHAPGALRLVDAKHGGHREVWYRPSKRVSDASQVVRTLCKHLVPAKGSE
ncbi:MAG: transcription-repair coupling factor [Phycisphaerae bacterium]|nr:transcription-repair coupling factor [Phycisphaerae bacterium]